MEQFFDPERVIAHPHLSLAAGAVRGWDRRNAYYFQLIRSLARHYEFDTETPWQELPAKISKIILYGSGREQIKFSYFNERGGRSSKTHAFEGIITNMERRYRDTESNAVREELSRYISTHACPSCKGTRLNTAARHVFITDRNLPELTALSIGNALDFFKQLKLPGKRGKIAEKVVKEISQRLEFLVNVGLDYLTLERSAETLSGGEAQRIRLASQIGAGLVGVMYVLDEPSIGLHQRDNARLLNTLTYLRDLGNTVIVVEHDEEAIRSADFVLDIGPGAGVHGGKVVAQGSAADIERVEASLTGQYLSGKQRIEIPQRTPRDPQGKSLTIRGASGNNLKQVDLNLPVGLFTCVTGVSGSGKSTLINDTLYPLAASTLNAAHRTAAPHTEILGLDNFDKVVDIDQSPIGRTPRSNPATYTGLFHPDSGTLRRHARGQIPGIHAGPFQFQRQRGTLRSLQR